MSNQIITGTLPETELLPINALAFISAICGEYLNTMTDKPATRQCVKMQVEDALRRLEIALQGQQAPQPMAPPPDAEHASTDG